MVTCHVCVIHSFGVGGGNECVRGWVGGWARGHCLDDVSVAHLTRSESIRPDIIQPTHVGPDVLRATS